jgi:hypothetical protein
VGRIIVRVLIASVWPRFSDDRQACRLCLTKPNLLLSRNHPGRGGTFGNRLKSPRRDRADLQTRWTVPCRIVLILSLFLDFGHLSRFF